MVRFTLTITTYAAHSSYSYDGVSHNFLPRCRRRLLPVGPGMRRLAVVIPLPTGVCFFTLRRDQIRPLLFQCFFVVGRWRRVREGGWRQQRCGPKCAPTAPFEIDVRRVGIARGCSGGGNSDPAPFESRRQFLTGLCSGVALNDAELTSAAARPIGIVGACSATAVLPALTLILQMTINCLAVTQNLLRGCVANCHTEETWNLPCLAVLLLGRSVWRVDALLLGDVTHMGPTS